MTDPVSSPVCPNRGVQLNGPFCASCGQHQRYLDRPLVELLGEALSSFISFDARLWRTLRILLLGPAKLTLEFLAGRRARYVHPLKLYLATRLGLWARSFRLRLRTPHHPALHPGGCRRAMVGPLRGTGHRGHNNPGLGQIVGPKGGGRDPIPPGIMALGNANDGPGRTRVRGALRRKHNQHRSR